MNETANAKKIEDYIQLTEEYYERDFSGRHTTIEKGSFGILIREDDVDTIYDITEKQKKRCFEMIEYGKKNDLSLALIAGYLCHLSKDQYIKKKPKSAIMPWEIF